MYFQDFYYDGERLSDYNCVVGSFGDDGISDRSLGSNLTFNTAPQLSGQHYLLASTQYGEVLTAEFDILKNPCGDDYTEYFTQEESRAIMRWLNRRAYLKFVPIYASGEAHDDIYFEGSFNVTAKLINGKVIGFSLILTTNRPFGLLEDVSYEFNLDSSTTYTITDISDEVGFIYCNATITCLESGDLNISNGIESRTTTIKNVTAGEVITMNWPMIETSVSGHKIQNDFDFNFIRIANTYDDRVNVFVSNLSCSISLTYNPIRKAGI